ncbi:hypothetical protein [Mesorhizobium sp. M1406]|uniref:hypothetical protein n=1 Tax=Mesorhizobium sp. M1406 TaxID=2957099 RepID=UPI00333D1B01
MFDVDISVLSALRWSSSRSPSTLSVRPALGANAIGRLSLAAFAGPIRFWLPLAGATLVAAPAGYGAMLLVSP